MGKFLDTTYHDTVNKVTGFYNDLVNNPFYTLNDKKPVVCTYYNIHKDYSSLDPGSKIHMALAGEESPIKYNRIYDFILYGFNRIELNTENGEFGLESDPIEGDCYILPNTIIPTENDFFEINHIKDSTWLFIVQDVQKDTLDNGSNVYKLSYKLQYISNEKILQNIVHNFRMISYKEGTNTTKIIRCEDYDIAKLLDEKAVLLKKYFYELFYNEKVQTFTYMDAINYRVYDPFMVEFLIRNKILENGEDYVHVCHQLFVPKTFGIDYNRTFFRCFETKDKENLIVSNHSTHLDLISSYGTTFAARFESYFKTCYGEYDVRPGFNTNCIKDELIYDIQDNKIQDEMNNMWKNIIIKYFNDETYSEDDIKDIDRYLSKSPYTSLAHDMFYHLPLLIFCLEKAIENVLK